MLKAVLFDVDFTLAKPGPELMPEGYVSCAERHGLALEASRYEAARRAALLDLQRHPELDHDEEIWVAFTERIVVGMGGAEPASHDVAVELTRRWQLHENFELYEDVQPVLGELRRAGLRIGLVSNSARATGSTSSPAATTRRGGRRSPTCIATPSSTTTRRSGSSSRNGSSRGWAEVETRTHPRSR